MYKTFLKAEEHMKVVLYTLVFRPHIWRIFAQ